MRLTAFSLLLLAGCGVPRPDTELCIVNLPAKHLTCYNMSRDYGQDGQLLPGVRAHFMPIPSLNKYLVIDPTSLGHLKAYLQILREEHSKCP